MIIDFGSLPNENLLIESLVNGAVALYDSYGDCGERCNHPSGFCNDSFCNKSSCQNCDSNNAFADEHNNCLGCCLECSEEVHYHSSKRRAAYRGEYDCQKLAYYYACRYSWKYCSEIMYALESLDLSGFDRFKILSLGCGAAPDLMAFEQINQEYNYPIKYLGVDKNQYWEKLHSEISDYCLKTNMKAQFMTGDIFEVLEQNFRNSLHEPNIIIMQYLISNFPNDERPQMVDALFDSLIENVISKKNPGKPLLVLLNDVYHNKLARDHFETLVRKLSLNGYHSTVCKSHFGERNGDYRDGSKKYNCVANKFNIPSDVKDKFNCAVQCSSAQMILEVR